MTLSTEDKVMVDSCQLSQGFHCPHGGQRLLDYCKGYRAALDQISTQSAAAAVYVQCRQLQMMWRTFLTLDVRDETD